MMRVNDASRSQECVYSVREHLIRDAKNSVDLMKQGLLDRLPIVIKFTSVTLGEGKNDMLPARVSPRPLP